MARAARLGPSCENWHLEDSGVGNGQKPGTRKGHHYIFGTFRSGDVVVPLAGTRERVNSPRLARVPRMSPSAEALERSEGEAKGQTYDYHRRSDDQR